MRTLAFTMMCWCFYLQVVEGGDANGSGSFAAHAQAVVPTSDGHGGASGPAAEEQGHVVMPTGEDAVRYRDAARGVGIAEMELVLANTAAQVSWRAYHEPQMEELVKTQHAAETRRTAAVDAQLSANRRAGMVVECDKAVAAAAEVKAVRTQRRRKAAAAFTATLAGFQSEHGPAAAARIAHHFRRPRSLFRPHDFLQGQAAQELLQAAAADSSKRKRPTQRADVSLRKAVKLLGGAGEGRAAGKHDATARPWTDALERQAEDAHKAHAAEAEAASRLSQGRDLRANCATYAEEEARRVIPLQAIAAEHTQVFHAKMAAHEQVQSKAKATYLAAKQTVAEKSDAVAAAKIAEREAEGVFKDAARAECVSGSPRLGCDRDSMEAMVQHILEEVELSAATEPTPIRDLPQLDEWGQMTLPKFVLRVIGDKAQLEKEAQEAAEKRQQAERQEAAAALRRSKKKATATRANKKRGVQGQALVTGAAAGGSGAGAGGSGGNGDGDGDGNGPGGQQVGVDGEVSAGGAGGGGDSATDLSRRRKSSRKSCPTADMVLCQEQKREYLLHNGCTPENAAFCLRTTSLQYHQHKNKNKYATLFLYLGVRKVDLVVAYCCLVRVT